MKKEKNFLLVYQFNIFSYIQFFCQYKFQPNLFHIAFLGFLEVAFGLDGGDCDKKVDES